MWAVLERWKRFLQLVAVTSGERIVTTTKIRDALAHAGAALTDVHFFSGVHTTFAFDVDRRDVARLGALLREAGLAFDAASDEALAAHEGEVPEGELHGTLAVTFSRGDPTLKRDVPSVPG